MNEEPTRRFHCRTCNHRWNVSFGGGRQWYVPGVGKWISIEPTPRSFLRAGEADFGSAGIGANEQLEPMKSYAKVALYSYLFNGGLMTRKYLLGMLSGSMALRADAMHSLTDVISSFFHATKQRWV